MTMNEMLASPQGEDRFLPMEDDDGQQEEDYIKVRLFFYSEDKKLMKDIFTDEWYVVTGGEYGEDEVSRDF